MMSKYHPYDKEMHQKFEALTTGMRDWRGKLADGSARAEDFVTWLEHNSKDNIVAAEKFHFFLLTSSPPVSIMCVSRCAYTLTCLRFTVS